MSKLDMLARPPKELQMIDFVENNPNSDQDLAARLQTAHARLSNVIPVRLSACERTQLNKALLELESCIRDLQSPFRGASKSNAR